METPSQPDIAYQFDIQKYKDRTKRRLETKSLRKELPRSFPSKLESPLAWTGSNFQNTDEYITVFTGEDLDDINRAVTHFKALELPLGQVCQRTFPLQSLKEKLRDQSTELHHGRGFFVLRGFPVDAFDRFDCMIAYAGISSYVGSLRGWQDTSGAVVAHITDLSASQAVGTPAYTNDMQVFHTDNGDIVSLLALEVSDEGGTSKVSSSWQVYNILAKERPDLIGTMSEDWPCDNFGGEPAFYMRPILYFTPEKRLVIQYFRRLFTGFGSLPRPSTIPPISEGQAEALDALQYYAEENCLKLDFQKGDIQYINNLSIFHAREAYKDGNKRRHLLRLWLRDEEHGWQIPHQLQSGPGRTWDSLRYEAASNKHRFSLVPEVKKE